MKRWWTVSCISMVLGVTAFPAAEPLVITPGNTAILDRSVYAGRFLQAYLIRGVAKLSNAKDYDFDSKLDRAASPAFPLYKTLDEVPAGKQLLIVGEHQRLKDYLSPEDLARLEASPGSVLLQRQGDNVVIAINGDPWQFAHIRIFMETYAGIRMYAPGEDDLWLAKPENNQFTVPADLNEFKAPYFAKVTFSSGGHERNATWLRFNSVLSGGLDLRAQHAIIYYFKPEKYYDKYPQLYPMMANGSRPRPTGTAWNPCLGDPELAAKVAMDEIREKMAAKQPPGYLSFGVMDCRYDCHCPVCAASLEAHDGDAANLWYDFLNRVARQCQQEFPKLYLTNYAYSNVNIPEGLQIEPNIVVDNVIKSYRFTDEAYWEGQRKEILAFADLGARWVTHDWNFQGVTPRIYSRQMASFLQWGAQNGMLGIYTEWSGREYWYLAGATYWVLRQQCSNPYQDPDGLWRQYCQDMFGAGWEPMYRFYDLFQQKQVVADWYFRRQDWPREEAVGFTEEDLALQRQWLERTAELTKDDPLIQRRLAAVKRYFRAHEMLARATGIPGRSFQRYTIREGQTGINDEALAFYVNDDGSRLLAFDEYYETKRTLPPDSNEEDNNSGIRFSYRNNYSRALGTIIAAIKEQAMTGVDLDQANEAAVKQVLANATRIFREHLPAKYDAKRAEAIQALTQKILWIPRADKMPTFDGNLNDGVWSRAAELTGWTQADLLIPTAEGNETEGKVMRVDDSLVFGIVCRQPNGIWAETSAEIETGTRIWRETSCEFFIGPPVKEGEEQEYAQYIVNSLGAFRGFRKADANRQDVHCAVSQAEDGKSYTIEVALPLKVADRYDYSQHRVLTFNIMRNPFYGRTFNSKERIGWAPIFFTAGRPESRGLIILE